jgi:kumamolisin
VSVRSNQVPLAGSGRRPVRARFVGVAPRLEPMAVTILLRPANGDLEGHVLELAARPPGERQHLTRTQFLEQFGATTEDVGRVRRFARNNQLNVVRVDRAAGSVELSGTTAQMESAFGVELGLYRTPTGVVRGRSGPIYVPRWLAPVVRGVFGLDTRKQARPRFRLRPGSLRGQFRPAAGPANSFTVPELATLYDFPKGGTGVGQVIGLIELDGGYRAADIDHYFTNLGISPPPSVVAVPVNGGANVPTGDPRGADGEVVLDIEVAGAVAPGAKIVVFFAPNTTKGFVDAVNAAVHDTSHNVSVVSISWGGCEGRWTVQAMNAMNASFQAANALGIPVFCASGDSGSGDGATDGLAHADFPSSSPYAVGCGGTTLQAVGRTIRREVSWNAGGGATGGGVSTHFPVPPYQATINPTSANPAGGPGRGVPDVAAVGDPATGYQVFIDGQALVMGGTSAVAPLFAGLTALIQQSVGHQIAPLHQRLYQSPQAFRDIVDGDNGDYPAGPGWDACTGLGAPIGTAILAANGHASSGPTKKTISARATSRRGETITPRRPAKRTSRGHAATGTNTATGRKSQKTSEPGP